MAQYHFAARLLFCLLIDSLLVPKVACVAIQAESEIPRHEDCAIFETALLNAQAITKGDVLIRRSAVFDGVRFDEQGKPNGLADSSESLVRCIFDFDRGLFALYENGIQNRVDFTVPENFVPRVFWVRPPLVEEWRVLMVDFDNSRFWISGSNGGSRQPQELDSLGLVGERDLVLKKLRFLDPRVLGTLPQLCCLGSGEQGLLPGYLNWFRQRASGRGFLEKLGPEKGKVTVRYSLPTGRDGLIHRDTVTFELDTGLPCVSLGQSRLHEADPWVFRFEEKTEWSKHKDIWVARSIHNSKPTSAHGASGTEVCERTEYQIDFHWFSVNEELDPRFFDGSRTGGKEEVLKWLDPEKNRATDLLPNRKEPSREKPAR